MGSAKNRLEARKTEKLVLANGLTPRITPQSDDKPLVHLSHTVVSTTELEEEFLRCSGTRYRCFSFVYILPEAIYWSPRALESYKLNVKKGNHIMLDSGAFSFQMFLVRKKKGPGEIARLVDKTLDQYTEFCKKHKNEVDWYVTFDWDQKAEVVWTVTKELEKRGLRPVPVYHGDQPTDWLKKYLDAGHKRIGISSLTRRRANYGETRRYLENVFRTVEPYKVKLHGFAVTSLSLMYAFPWDSVDSSSWSRTASYGAIYTLDPDRGTMAAIHVSKTGGLQSGTRSITELSGGALKSVKEHIERKGWDFDLLRRSLQYRFIFNAAVFTHLNEYKEKLAKRYHQWEILI